MSSCCLWVNASVTIGKSLPAKCGPMPTKWLLFLRCVGQETLLKAVFLGVKQTHKWPYSQLLSRIECEHCFLYLFSGLALPASHQTTSCFLGVFVSNAYTLLRVLELTKRRKHRSPAAFCECLLAFPYTTPYRLKVTLFLGNDFSLKCVWQESLHTASILRVNLTWSTDCLAALSESM